MGDGARQIALKGHSIGVCVCVYEFLMSRSAFWREAMGDG